MTAVATDDGIVTEERRARFGGDRAVETSSHVLLGAWSIVVIVPFLWVVLSSFKVEDPEPVAAAESGATLLTRLPVRVRLAGTLPQLMSILQALERASPRIDLRTLRLVSEEADGHLEIELVLARYLMAAPAQDLSIIEAMGRQETAPPAAGKARSRNKKPAPQAQEGES